MAQPVLVKVYGGVRPLSDGVLPALERALSVLGADAGHAFTLEGGELLLSHEGAFFPLDDVLEALKPGLSAETAGRIDYFDLEEWVMTRCVIEAGRMVMQRRGLNDVLDYSGH